MESPLASHPCKGILATVFRTSKKGSSIVLGITNTFGFVSGDIVHVFEDDFDKKRGEFEILKVRDKSQEFETKGPLKFKVQYSDLLFVTRN